MKKAKEIELLLSEHDIDLWKLRELALTEGGLVNGAYTSHDRKMSCMLLQLNLTWLFSPSYLFRYNKKTGLAEACGDTRPVCRDGAEIRALVSLSSRRCSSPAILRRRLCVFHVFHIVNVSYFVSTGCINKIARLVFDCTCSDHQMLAAHLRISQTKETHLGRILGCGSD